MMGCDGQPPGDADNSALSRRCEYALLYKFLAGAVGTSRSISDSGW